jgi:2-keto-4-pentenoate hydratase/2-oxohepta-3-ene-1,7-dioic acid hydratase in catechol pathway
MKILYFDDFRLGVLRGEDEVVDVSAAVRDIPHVGPGDLMNALIGRFGAYRGKIEAAAKSGTGIALSKVRIRPPLPRPGNIDCMAVNYMENGTLPEPAPINAFHKAINTIIGPGDTMVLQDVPATIFEGEAELGLVIGKPCSNVSAAEAMDYVFGYFNFIDGSARGLGPATNLFFQMKTRDTFAPIGPWIVTADEVDDPQNLAIRLWVNGTLYQDFNTDDMAHNIPRCIEWISSIHALEPGDIIATGTNHRGLNPFQDGDRVELECEGMGRLAINIRDDLKRTWARVTRLQHKESGKEGAFTPQLTGKYAPGG